MERPSTLKIIVIGDGWVGKTALLIRHAENAFRNEYSQTILTNNVVDQAQWFIFEFRDCFFRSVNRRG